MTYMNPHVGLEIARLGEGSQAINVGANYANGWLNLGTRDFLEADLDISDAARDKAL